jgi:arylsulfatase A-like enzyme
LQEALPLTRGGELVGKGLPLRGEGKIELGLKVADVPEPPGEPASRLPFGRISPRVYAAPYTKEDSQKGPHVATPNLLFLYSDEQRYDTLSCYGNHRIEMPNLNRLAEQSCVFDRAYVTQPVCTPSRSSLLTGLYPHTNGCTANNVPLRRETPCLPEMLSRGDYLCGHFGKWHLGDEIYPQHGFSEWRSTEDGYHKWYSPDRNQADRSTYDRFLRESGFLPDVVARGRFSRPFTTRIPERFSKPAYLADEAGRFIRRNRRRPWVLYVNFLEPHMPFHSVRDHQYDPADVELPDNFHDKLGAGASLKARLGVARFQTKGFEGLPLTTEADWRRLIARYWGLCSLVDTHCGRVLEALAECRLEDRTIIVFTSDHGDMMGSHRLLAKGYMFEESARVPLLVRLPGQSRQRHIAGPVSQIDLVPTLLDLMGQGVGDHLEGKSLRACMEEGGEAGDDVFIEWIPPEGGGGDIAGGLPDYAGSLCTLEQARAAYGDSVRTIVTSDNWKLSFSAAGEHQLFDLAGDPLEMSNLAGDASHAPRMRDLAGRIRAWQRRVGDTLELPRQDFET